MKRTGKYIVLLTLLMLFTFKLPLYSVSTADEIGVLEVKIRTQNALNKDLYTTNSNVTNGTILSFIGRIDNDPRAGDTLFSNDVYLSVVSVDSLSIDIKSTNRTWNTTLWYGIPQDQGRIDDFIHQIAIKGYGDANPPPKVWDSNKDGIWDTTMLYVVLDDADLIDDAVDDLEKAVKLHNKDHKVSSQGQQLHIEITEHSDEVGLGPAVLAVTTIALAVSLMVILVRYRRFADAA